MPTHTTRPPQTSHIKHHDQRSYERSPTSDTANALGKIQDIVVDAAKPVLIRREIIWVLLTTKTLVRFQNARLGKANRTAKLSQVWVTQEKYDTEDVKADMKIKAGAEKNRIYWTKSSSLP